jgi:two-component system, OmpR family, response regulator VicR
VHRTAILLLEDDPNLGLILQEHLVMNGFDSTIAVDGAEGLAVFRRQRVDLCLVDVMMPRMDGFSFAREVRRLDQRVPLMFLTAKALKEDRIKGLKIGADDYITKPFSMEELLLRIKAVLKRSAPSIHNPVMPDHFTLGSYTFHYPTRSLVQKGRSRRLTAREADLLRLLCVNRNTLLHRADILRELWGDDTYFNGRSMDVFISRLRRHVKGDPAIQILSEHGRGFKLVVDGT